MVNTTLLHKTPYGAENTMYYLLFAIELYSTKPYQKEITSYHLQFSLESLNTFKCVLKLTDLELDL